MADGLSASRPYLARELVDEAAFGRLLEAARFVPADVMAAIEIRLLGDDEAVDLAARLLEPHQARDLLPSLAESPGFLRSYLATWARSAPSDRAHPLHSLWLEFDLAREPISSLPDPVICARLRSSAKLDWVASELLPAIHGMPLSTPQQRLLRTAWEAIPDSCSPLYAFSLRARGDHSIRLEMYAEEFQSAWTWLRRLNHPNIAALRRATDSGIVTADRLHLSCDIEPGGLSSRLGLEGSFRRQPSREPGWARLLRRFVEDGLCESPLVAALEEWPGWTSSDAGHLVRALSHLKLSFDDHGAATGKVYLIVQQLPAAA